MQYFVPVLKLSGELPPQNSPTDKLGGLPWGLAVDRWPICENCGQHQSLLAQFLHHDQRLNLGRSGRLLSVFQCNHDPGNCATWEGDSGANACLISEPEDLQDGLTLLPEDSPEIEREARIVDWLPRDDGIDAASAASFYSGAEFYELPEAALDQVSWITRLGGVPAWVQSPDEAPEGWTFIGQLTSLYNFIDAPSVIEKGIEADPSSSEGFSHYCEGPNFGDGGIGYLFVRNIEISPEGYFFWQCS